MRKFKLNEPDAPGVRFTKQVQQTLSLTLNSELIYSEIGNSDQFGVVSPGVKRVHYKYKKTASMEPRFDESPWQRGRGGLRFSPHLELEILMHSNGEFVHVFRGKCNTTAEAKSGRRSGARVNA